MTKDFMKALVAPHAGAWIETGSTAGIESYWDCRAPCGRVD